MLSLTNLIKQLTTINKLKENVRVLLRETMRVKAHNVLVVFQHFQNLNLQQITNDDEDQT